MVTSPLVLMATIVSASMLGANTCHTENTTGKDTAAQEDPIGVSSVP